MIRILFTIFFILGLIGSFIFAFIKVSKQKKNNKDYMPTENDSSTTFFSNNLVFLKVGFIYAIICSIIVCACSINVARYFQLDTTVQGTIMSIIDNTTTGEKIGIIHYMTDGRISVLETEIPKNMQENEIILVRYNSKKVTMSMLDGSYGLVKFWVIYFVFSIVYLLGFTIFSLTTLRDIADFKKRYGN